MSINHAYLARSPAAAWFRGPRPPGGHDLEGAQSDDYGSSRAIGHRGDVRGLGLTVAAIILLYVDHATGNVLVGHIRGGYPSYGQVRIDAAVTTYPIYLSVLGALGVLSWLCTIWAASTRKPWARWVATALFAAGTSIALFNLLVKDTSGDTGLPPLLGWVGMLPSLAGLLAVVFLWRKPRARGEGMSRAPAIVSGGR